MDRKPNLRSVCEHGPIEHRHISGTCSVCGDTILTWLDGNEVRSPHLLRTRLDTVFAQHVVEKHQDCAPGSDP